MRVISPASGSGPFFVAVESATAKDESLTAPFTDESVKSYYLIINRFTCPVKSFLFNWERFLILLNMSPIKSGI